MRLTEGAHRIIELRASAVESRRDVGHLELAGQPQQRSGDIRETPCVHTRLGTREGALELAAALEDMEGAGEVSLTGDRKIHVLEKDSLLRRKVDPRANVVRHLGEVREIDGPVDDGR